MYIPRWLKRRIREGARLQAMSAMTEKTDASKVGTAMPASPTVPGVDPSADAEQLRTGMQAIRDNLRAYGVALGAIATAVFAGVSLAVIDALFPLPRGRGWIALIAFTCALLGVGGLAALTTALFAAQRRIVFTPAAVCRRDYRELRPGAPKDDFNPEETATVEAVLKEHAAEENASSALSLERRALRLARVARRLEREGSDQAKAAAAIAIKESGRLNDVLTIAVVRASVSVLEQRASRILGSFAAWALTVTVIGAIGLVFSVQYVQGQRELIGLGESCAKAEAAGAADACTGVNGITYEAPPTPSTPTTLELVDRLAACTTEVDEQLESTQTIPAALRNQFIAACMDLKNAEAAEAARAGESASPDEN